MLVSLASHQPPGSSLTPEQPPRNPHLAFCSALEQRPSAQRSRSARVRSDVVQMDPACVTGRTTPRVQPSRQAGANCSGRVSARLARDRSDHRAACCTRDDPHLISLGALPCPIAGQSLFGSDLRRAGPVKQQDSVPFLAIGVGTSVRHVVTRSRSIRLVQYSGARYHMHGLYPRALIRRQPKLRSLELPAENWSRAGVQRPKSS
jgi:hypothetical protein